ncbi:MULTISPECIES: hypothetical protein [unclassified Devosia]|uniref:hypothetical protein n=1 Tax=unclassified Devosia TaxID=196773 RepID=UPI001AC34181|nr:MULTISPECIES: hypothetical protein [unclassified Devosia]MBN9305467.1 hypothetical protein [Devosia sp.]
MSDESLRQDILDELEFGPCVDASRIGVAEQGRMVRPPSAKTATSSRWVEPDQ